MTDHLPECPTCADPMDCIPNGHYPSVSVAGPALCSKACICDRLRACEARVRREHDDCICGKVDAMHSIDGVLLSVCIDDVEFSRGDEFERGYAAALDAARDAVAAVPLLGTYNLTPAVWAAIDALRGES